MILSVGLSKGMVRVKYFKINVIVFRDAGIRLSLVSVVLGELVKSNRQMFLLILLHSTVT